MSLLGRASRLSDVLDLGPCKIPDEFIEWAGFDADRRGPVDVGVWIRRCQAMLHLYDVVHEGDSSALPTQLVSELAKNEELCVAVLVHANWCLQARRPAWLALQRLLEGSGHPVEESIGRFLADQVTHLFCDSSGGEHRIEPEELTAVFNFTKEQRSALRLAECVASHDDRSPQITIGKLKELADNRGPAGLAACLFLSRVYAALQLPLEERTFIQRWVSGIQESHDMSVAHYAATRATVNSELESTIVESCRRLVDLLRASAGQSQVDALVHDFETHGYGSKFAALRAKGQRSAGVDLRILAREDVAAQGSVRRLLAGALLRSPLRQACFVLRDDSAADVEAFPTPRRGAAEEAILQRLADEVADASVAVHPEIVDEGVLEQRKWILCYDMARPIEALALGVMALERESSVVYARAVLFDTELDSSKDEDWFSDASRVLGAAFDAQKKRVVQEAVRRIVQQASSGHSTVEVEEL